MYVLSIHKYFTVSVLDANSTIFIYEGKKVIKKKKKHFSIHSLPKEPLNKFVCKTCKNNVYSTR